MIIGLGSDLIDISRIERTLERFGDRFVQRCFTEVERTKSDRRANRADSYAKRYAAKEAVYKALATGWQEGLGWQDIEISNEPNGMPIANVSGKLKKFFADDKELKISMSHSRDYVSCVAIIYKLKTE